MPYGGAFVAERLTSLQVYSIIENVAARGGLNAAAAYLLAMLSVGLGPLLRHPKRHRNRNV